MTSAGNRRLIVITTIALVVAAGTARASAAVTLGTAGTGTASCPASCLVEARVTGFQTTVGGIKASTVAPSAGRITGWQINLGAPTRAANRFFGDRFGPAMARLSILKPLARKKGKRTFRLLRQSPLQALKPHFGKLATFTLAKPLKIGKGQRIALTIPTWAPAFSVGHTDGTTWRASRASTRKRGDCFTDDGLANLDAGAPQQRPGSDRRYGCSYRGAMLLYSADFTPRTS